MFRRVAAVMLVALCAMPVLAEEVDDEDDDPIPAEARDVGFSRYVDLDLLRSALNDRDASLLCDVALQLTEGERILLRSHKGLPASKVFRMALDVATEKRDKETLGRLLRAAKGQGRKELVEVIETTIKTAGPRRKVDMSLLVAPDSMSVEALVIYRGVLEQIKLAASLNDRERLEELEKSIARIPDLEERQRTGLKKMITDARKNLPEKSEEGDDLLRKLAASARGYRVIITPTKPHHHHHHKNKGKVKKR